MPRDSRSVTRSVPHRVPLTCAVNAAAAREDEMTITPAETRKAVVVVDAGPAGMEGRGWVAALRGHAVYLADRRRTIGGTPAVLGARSEPPQPARPRCVLRDELSRLGVQLMLGNEVTADELIEFAPATALLPGADRRCPTYPAPTSRSSCTRSTSLGARRLARACRRRPRQASRAADHRGVPRQPGEGGRARVGTVRLRIRCRRRYPVPALPTATREGRAHLDAAQARPGRARLGVRDRHRDGRRASCSRCDRGARLRAGARRPPRGGGSRVTLGRSTSSATHSHRAGSCTPPSRVPVPPSPSTSRIEPHLGDGAGTPPITRAREEAFWKCRRSRR